MPFPDWLAGLSEIRVVIGQCKHALWLANANTQCDWPTLVSVKTQLEFTDGRMFASFGGICIPGLCPVQSSAGIGSWIEDTPVLVAHEMVCSSVASLLCVFYRASLPKGCMTFIHMMSAPGFWTSFPLHSQEFGPFPSPNMTTISERMENKRRIVNWRQMINHHLPFSPDRCSSSDISRNQYPLNITEIYELQVLRNLCAILRQLSNDEAYHPIIYCSQTQRANQWQIKLSKARLRRCRNLSSSFDVRPYVWNFSFPTYWLDGRVYALSFPLYYRRFCV